MKNIEERHPYHTVNVTDEAYQILIEYQSFFQIRDKVKWSMSDVIEELEQKYPGRTTIDTEKTHIFREVEKKGT